MVMKSVKVLAVLELRTCILFATVIHKGFKLVVCIWYNYPSKMLCMSLVEKIVLKKKSHCRIKHLWQKLY